MRMVGIVIGIVRAPDSRGSEGISFRFIPAVAVGIWRGSSGSRVQGADQGRDPTKMVNGKFLFDIFRPGEGPYEEIVVIA